MSANANTGDSRPRTTAIIFGAVIAVCLAQVTWWLLFQLSEADRLEQIAGHLQAGDTDGVLRAFDARHPDDLRDEAHSRRTMFAAEGAALGILGLTGVVFFYAALLRERRMRREQHRFLTGATHELKTPLATLRLGLESIQNDTVPEGRRDHYVASMLREVDRLQHGLTNVLVAAQTPKGSDAIRSVDDLASDVRRVFAEFEDRFRAAGIRAELTVPERPVPVSRDPHAMSLVIRNLLDNALKYSTDGLVQIALTASAEHAVLTVADQGCGIATDEIPRIFDRFVRGSTAPHVGGTGLGLSLSREIVGQHGGRIEARSPGVGEGAKFTVTLPLEPSP